MHSTAVLRAAGVALLFLAASCSRHPDPPGNTAPLPATRAATATRPTNANVIRATGLVQALEWQSVRVPQLSGMGFDFTLTKLIPNGAKVSKGDVLVEFDRLTLLDQERDAKALLEDLGHQLDEKRAQVKSQAATRVSQIREAQADLDRARIQLRKGPVLSDIDRLKNEAKAENAEARLASLKKSDGFRATSEVASVRILELKVERQKVTLERVQSNLSRLIIKAPQDGMVAHESTWRMGQMGPPQVGDRMWPGMPVLRIFNPAHMVVQVSVDEPDFAVVSNAARAKLYLDAYPGAAFDAFLMTASPVATSGLDSPVRNFIATFRIEQQSPQLLPDLSAALEIERTPKPAAPRQVAEVRK